ncbi:MAG: ABC transporter ATP-binding protein [Kineosporiaceae bacterium]
MSDSTTDGEMDTNPDQPRPDAAPGASTPDGALTPEGERTWHGHHDDVDGVAVGDDLEAELAGLADGGGAPELASWAGALVEVRGVGVTLGRNRVLDGVDLAVEPGRWLGVVGPNGAGKSTLLRVLAGLARHDGSVLLDGNDVATLGARERARLVGYAPQVPLLPDGVRVREYVMLGRTPHRGMLAGPRESDRSLVDDVLERLDLTSFADRPLRTLSGGERQRAVLGRALAQQPRLLLLDEPTSALDLGHAQQVLELVDALRREDGLTVISTLHDLVLAGQYADHLLLLSGGHVAAHGRPAEVLTTQALKDHYGANAHVESGPEGLRVVPVRPSLVIR